MFDSVSEDPSSGDHAALGALLDGWSRDPRLGPRLTAPGAAWFVLDGQAAHVLRASAAADGLRRAIADDGSVVATAVRLGDQIRPSGLAAERPILARIRFDARRIGTPATCIVVRTLLADGRPVVIVALTEPPPVLRPLPGRAASIAPHPVAVETVREQGEPAAAEPLAGPARFTWRSDANDTLTLLSGPAAATVRGPMIGRSWQDLSAAKVLVDGDALLAALAARQTFRTVPATLRLGSAGLVDLDLSGVPAERAGSRFKGFNGFGLVRPSAAVPEVEPEPATGRDTPSFLADDHGSQAAVTVLQEPAEPGLPLALLPGTVWGGIDPAPPATADEPAPVLTPASAAGDTRLSSNEHDAFREIARALGARFAGDDEAASPAVEKTGDAHGTGSVTPFPTPAPRPAETAAPDPDAAVIDTLERLPSGVLVYRGDTILFANRALLALAGFADVAAMEAAGGLARLFGGLAPHERTALEAPTILTTRDGGSLGVDLQGSILDWRGAPAELLLARDSSVNEPQRQRAAEKIARDFARSRAADALAVLDSLEDGLLTLDGNARILGLNRSAAATFGLDPREVVGASVLNLFAPESAVDVLAGIHGVPGPAHAGPSAARTVLGRTASGTMPLEIRIVPLSGSADGRLAATIRPAAPSGPADPAEAEARTTRAAAEVVSAGKSDFLAKVSHEIRTPMNGILGFADMMLAEPFGPLGDARYRDYLTDIHASGTHALSLVEDLLDLARIEAGRLDLTFSEVPLNDIVSGCVALMQPLAARERVVVRTSFSDALTTLVADERSVRQAAFNIIANAIQFTEAGGQVIVSTTMADRGEIALRVRDTGIGMTPDEVETALEPFRQVSVSVPRKGRSAGNGRSSGNARSVGNGMRPSTGLGLPLTKALIEANHGQFRITSRKDEGTLVEMLFPPKAVTKTA